MMGYKIFNRATPGKFCQQPKQFVIGLLITLLTTPTTTFCHTSTGVNNKIRNKSTSQLLNFSTGGSCEVSQLPDMRFYHTQVIFDNIVSIHMNITLLEWKVGLWRIVYLRHLFTTG